MGAVHSAEDPTVEAPSEVEVAVPTVAGVEVTVAAVLVSAAAAAEEWEEAGSAAAATTTVWPVGLSVSRTGKT